MTDRMPKNQRRMTVLELINELGRFDEAAEVVLYDWKPPSQVYEPVTRIWLENGKVCLR